MSDEPVERPSVNRELPRAVAALTLITVLAFGLFVVSYDYLGLRLLAHLDRSLGEVMMKEGMQYQQAGATENAKERYAAALASRFAGEQNRVYTLKLLGTMWWSEGAYEKAVPLLREAAESAHAEMTFFEPYVDTLLHLGRLDDAAVALERWQQSIAKKNDQALMAAAKFQEGKLAQARQDAAGARRAFEEGAMLEPGGRNAAELAVLQFEAGELAEALRHIDAYLAAGGGARGEQLRALRAKIVAAQPSAN